MLSKSNSKIIAGFSLWKHFLTAKPTFLFEHMLAFLFPTLEELFT